MPLACPLQFERLVDKVVATSTAYFFQIPSFDRVEAALAGPILVNAAGATTVFVLFQKRTFEEYLAACAAAVALAAPERERRDDLFFTKVYIYESPKLALRLAGAEPSVFDGAQALGRGNAFLKQTATAGGPISSCKFHPVQVDDSLAGHANRKRTMTTEPEKQKWRGRSSENRPRHLPAEDLKRRRR